MQKKTKKVYESLRPFIYAFLSLVILCVFIFSLYSLSFEKPKFELGVSFTKSQAEYLGLDWKKVYLAALDDLKVKNIRLSMPWNDVEPIRDEYRFADYDWMIEEAQKRKVDIILTLGRRTPRWPECHDPSWLGEFSGEYANDRVLKLLRAEIAHFKKYNNIKLWQVENEPLLEFYGVCPKPDINFLRKEVSLAQTLDSRKIMVTDSGELSSWFGAANTADVFGTSIYRVVYNQYLGYSRYFFPPVLYNLKARIAGVEPKNVIVSELQTEPWSNEGLKTMRLEEQLKFMNAEELAYQVSFARRAGFAEAYMWGVEWWYWMKTNHGDDSLWNTAKELIQLK